MKRDREGRENEDEEQQSLRPFRVHGCIRGGKASVDDETR